MWRVNILQHHASLTVATDPRTIWIVSSQCELELGDRSMRNAIFVLSVIFAFQLWGQERSTISVKAAEVSTGVVIVTAQRVDDSAKRTSIQLQCNQGLSGCTELKPGTYTMVRLPKNRGMYDCTNADLYSVEADPATALKIGEYCLTEK